MTSTKYPLKLSKKNIFLTGAPSSGKTTAIKKILADLDVPCTGFYTEQELANGKRVGFVMHTIDGRYGYLAHQDIDAQYHIRRYGVDIENIETLAVPSIQPKEGQVIILDEIGKMECFSSRFTEAAKRALDSENVVIGTITLGGTDFIQSVKERDDIDLIELTEENRDEWPAIIVHYVKNRLQ